MTFAAICDAVYYFGAMSATRPSSTFSPVARRRWLTRYLIERGCVDHGVPAAELRRRRRVKRQES